MNFMRNFNQKRVYKEVYTERSYAMLRVENIV